MNINSNNIMNKLVFYNKRPINIKNNNKIKLKDTMNKQINKDKEMLKILKDGLFNKASIVSKSSYSWNKSID